MMKKILLSLCLFISGLTLAQSNLPPCNGNYVGPCFVIVTYSGGGNYAGEYRNDKRNGQGKYSYFNGDKYIGGWKDGEKNGHGTYTFANGDKYVGEWKDGKKNGQGTSTWANGDKYVGKYKDDKYDEFGTLYFADGSIFQQGLWKDGEFVQAQSSPTVFSPVAPVVLPVVPKPTAIKSNPQEIKRQKCIRLGLAPGSSDFQQCMN
jgi:hypothetical protein